MKSWYAKSKAKRYRNKPHIAYWTTPDQHQESFGTQAEAIGKVMEMQRRIDAGEFDPKQYTFGEAADRWLKLQELKPVTRHMYDLWIRNQLADYLDMPLHEFAQLRREITDLCLAFQDGNRLGRMITKVCDLAMAEGEIAGHRMAQLPIPKRRFNVRELIPHNAEQLTIILANMPERYRAAILIMRGCGLRIGETLALETDAIHDGYLEVRRATSSGYDGTPKKRYAGFKPRKVPIPHWLAPEIDAHIARYAKDGILFPSSYHYSPRGITHRSKYISSVTVADHFRGAARLAGLPVDHPKKDLKHNFTFHQLRKNYATQLRAEALDLGISFADIEDWLGHKNLTRNVYAFQGTDAIDRGRKLSDPRQVSEEK